MTGLIPWRKKRADPASNGGSLATVRSFPAMMRRMHDELDTLFDSLVRDWPVAWEGMGKPWRWNVDLDETADAVVVKAEAPGFEPGDFDVRVNNDRLMLRAAKKSKATTKDGEHEESCECFESLMLPPGIDSEKVDARYRDGVLSVTIPKTAEGKGKSIAVKGE